MKLTGKVTPGGWEIGESVKFPGDHTGGNFSDCYFVEREGQKAFLKALDIEQCDISGIGAVISAFQYESDLLTLCRERKLGRIIQILESDKVERDSNAVPAMRYVPFFVFELADGDIRESIDVSRSVTDQWKFRVLHQTTLALLQLHKEQIAHQDLKPSNVLQFGKDILKLGDLGSASHRGKASPRDGLAVVGASMYAPFELRYEYFREDWLERRLGIDVFHLGCLVVFAFANVCFPEYVIDKLDEPFKPQVWGGSYDEVAVFIESAMIDSIVELEGAFPDEFKQDLINIVLDLCHPNPAERGRTNLKRQTNVLWLERYASTFDLLEKRSRIKRVKKNA